MSWIGRCGFLTRNCCCHGSASWRAALVNWRAAPAEFRVRQAVLSRAQRGLMVRTVGKLLLVGTLAASFTACLDSTSVDDGTQSVDRENDALTIVVNDMRGLIPAEVVDEPNRVLGAQFQGASPPPCCAGGGT